MSSSNGTPKRITRDGRLKTDPCFVRGGSELIFTVQEKPSLLCLMRLNVEDGSVERLHPQADTSEFEASFAADERAYAFVQSRGNLNLKLVIRDPRQNHDAGFHPEGGFVSLRRPSIAPDGSRVIFSLPGNNGQQIQSVDAQGHDLKALTHDGLNSWPAFSPDGQRIAFGSSRAGDFDIHVMDADGGNVRRLTRSPGLDMRPAWSPDGQRIAFTSNRDGKYEIYVMNGDGSMPRRITINTERDDYPAWHPDGKHLVFVGERAGRSDLYLLDV